MKRMLILISLGLLGSVPAWSAPAGPSGIWRTFDDDGVETGRVQIWEQNQILYGKVVAIADPAKAKAVCRDCTDDRRNQPVLGMQIMRGLKADDKR